ncbi:MULTISPECIES: lipid droplet-associated protein [unclassified Saccharopolyspora]|uniref:lipid droplet-associated protein n=1 Tax=unclassified Saccharopolyspora TaxID=2646250 RepID=UPI001CD7A26D|nr:MULTISPECIES: lipid droplet-associated protein [unclassified Saccharopolyspora]MCA1190346.1 lipid droplet-associated protein [Saccharopolyspora sp. 6T]MCA1195592.1 lipid droplet-associated protein [Saccharopolyspora sp. 6V]MCA1228364.1 lipid droplet-associated protein [Saccharopolyspora sp. 6M]MCA1282577.1 lipid droplet-associated protein [Saccharopolyspora sp. 7B]
MSTYPLPIRVAAGLAAVTAEQTRRLPAQLLGLPLTVASQALQLSMRMQQQITELAIRGDEALGAWDRGEDQPEWATFDEDEPAPAAPAPDDAGVLAGYEGITLPQLRGRLRGFSTAEVEAMLDHERANQQRPEFLRMLGNRLERLRTEN